MPFEFTRTFVRAARAFLYLSLLLIAVVALDNLPGASFVDASHNSVTPSVSLDTESAENTATSISTIESCTALENIGDPIEVDIIVENVSDLDAYDLRVGYDAAILKVTAVDTNFLLAANAGSSLSDTIDPLPDADGTLRVSSTDTDGGAGESGSGVLVRVTLEGVAAGTSPLTFVVDATAPATPAMFDTAAAAIGDLDGDTIFDGDRLNASVAVEVGCPDFLENELLVSFVAGTPQGTIDSIISTLGTKQIDFLPELDVYWLQVVDGSTSLDTAAAFLQQPEVEFAEPNFLMELDDHQDEPNDPAYLDSEQWALTNVGQNIAPDGWTPGVGAQQGIIDVDIDAPQAWDIRVKDCRGPDPANPLRIAVIDDGVDATHPDLAGNLDLVNSRNTVTNVAGAAAVQHNPGDSHGTYVSGVIGALGNNAAEVAGVCWQAQIVVYKTIRANGRLSTSAMIRAVDNIIALNAGGAKIRVVNFSISGPTASLAELRALNRLGAAGVLFVTTSSNQGVNVDEIPRFPCSFNLANMICVGATDNQDGLLRDPALDPFCRNKLDDDGDTLINDGCPARGAAEAGAQCANALDDDGDRLINDGCPASAAEVGAQCANPLDDDGDGLINDGCPIDSEAGAQCTNNIDDDGDTLVNDGCPTVASFGGPELSAECGNAADDDGDGAVNDGCPAVAAAEVGAACANAADDDADTVVNDGCPSVGNGTTTAEAGARCGNNTDDDGDTFVNDGCPAVVAEAGAECVNGTDDDGDTLVNDGCPAVGAGGGENVLSLSEDGAGPGTCSDFIDNGPDGTADFLDADCYVTQNISNFGPNTVHILAPGDDIRVLCSTNPVKLDRDGDGLKATCDQSDFEPDADYDGITDGPNDPDGANGMETNALCVNGLDDDRDTFINDNCPSVGVGPEAGAQCAARNNIDDDGDTVVNDGCPTRGPFGEDTTATCPQLGFFDGNDTDRDGFFNDGCPALGPGGANNAETDPANPGCPANGGGGTAQCGTASACAARNGIDDDNDGFLNDGCPVVNLTAGPDNCPTVANTNQANADGDTRGDVCDPEPNEAHALNVATTRLIDGTSFAAPHVTAVAAQCFAMFPGFSATEVKSLILRFPDRKPAFQSLVSSEGRLRWPCAYDLGDAPNSYQSVSKEGSAPELLRCTVGTTGPIHLDYGNEWYGPDATTEHNANTPRTAGQNNLEQDPRPNLGPALAGPDGCSTSLRPVNRDVADDNAHFFFPPPPWVSGQIVGTVFTVCSDHLRDTNGDGGADVQVLDAAGGRYSAADPDKRVYATLWFDWDGDGNFIGEYTPLFPTDTITEVELPATAAPQTRPPKGCVEVARTFVAQSPLPPWYRWRLDYGEHKGDNDPLPLFKKDQTLPVDEELRISIFGEVEDYPLRSIKIIKLDGDTFRPVPGWDVTLFPSSDCSGTAIESQTTNANGVADFFGLTEGQYSVEEETVFGWASSSVCSPADLTGSLPLGALDPPASTTFSPEGGFFELLMATRMGIEVSVGDAVLRDEVTVTGPAQIVLQPPGDADGDGLTDVPTEIVQMDLVGSSPILGSVRVSTSSDAAMRSVGEIEQETASSDFPAVSFFDVFFEIELLDQGVTVHSETPLRLQPEFPIPSWPPFQIPFLPPPSSLPVDLIGANLPDPVGSILVTMGMIPIFAEQWFIPLINFNLDKDLDGVFDDVEIACGSDPSDAASVPERIDGLFGGADDDGDGLTDEVLPDSATTSDCDGDGYTGAAEDTVYSYIGQTDGDQKTCQEYDSSHPNPGGDINPSLRWPSDFNNATFPLNSLNKINILDLASFLAPVKYFGTDVGTNPGDVRWDLDPGPDIFTTDINILDLTAMIAGASGNPPMLGGVKAFGGPVCPWAP